MGFINQCVVLGKIRGILPYQPDYRKFDDPLLMQDGDDVDSLVMPATACAQCDARQVHHMSCCGEMADKLQLPSI